MFGFYRIISGTHEDKLAFVLAPSPGAQFSDNGPGIRSRLGMGSPSRDPAFWAIVHNVPGFTRINGKDLLKFDVGFNSVETVCHSHLDAVAFERNSKVITRGGDDMEETIRTQLANFTKEKTIEPMKEQVVTKETIQTNSNRHPHADAIHAWAEGATIITRSGRSSKWYVATEPEWTPRDDYKVAFPAVYMVVIVNGQPVLMQVATDDENAEKVMLQAQQNGTLVYVKTTNAIFQKISHTGETKIDWVKTAMKGILLNAQLVQLFLDQEGNVITE